MRLWIACLCVALIAAGCGGNSPTAPSVAQIAGGWSGTFESNYLPEAVFVDLTQVGSTVTGTWAMTSGVRASGNISGAVDASQFTGVVTYNFSGGPVCQASFAGPVSSGTITWSSPGFTGNCGLSAPGNPINARFVLQRRQ